MPIPRVPFYLLRHGESAANKKRIWGGWMETPLTDAGIQQAKDVQPVLSHLNISKVYHSTIGRAHQTTIYATEGTGLDFVPMDDLREANFGKYEGEDYGTGSMDKWLDGAMNESNMGISPCGHDGESFHNFKKRIAHALESILLNHQTGHPPILVCHGGVFRATRSLLFNEIAPNSLPNCGLAYFEPILQTDWEVSLLHPQQAKNV